MIAHPHIALFVCIIVGLMPLPGGLPPLPNLPNLNLPLPDLSAVSLSGPPPVGTTGKCTVLISVPAAHYILYMHSTLVAPKVQVGHKLNLITGCYNRIGKLKIEKRLLLHKIILILSDFPFLSCGLHAVYTVSTEYTL